jgi:hypothetical protein
VSRTVLEADNKRDLGRDKGLLALFTWLFGGSLLRLDLPHFTQLACHASRLQFWLVYKSLTHRRE